MSDVLDDVEVAEILSCDPKTVQEKARLGELPAVKYGRSWRFPRVALLQVLNEMALANMKKKAAPKAIHTPAPERKSRRRSLPVLHP